MSKLEELIKEFCPNGVEYVKIGSVVNYEQPSKYLVKKADYKEEYSTPVLTAGQTFILGYTNEMNGIYNASKDNPVIIFDDFTGAFKWVDFPFKVKSSAIKFLKANEKRAMLRYVFHVMGNINLTSTEHKRLWIGIYSELQIPLPALPVQREIVRILDSFTLYSAELTAELTARRKQYEFYRDKLLRFESGNIPRVKLKDIATEFYRGYGITREQVTKEGIPCVRYGEIYTTYNTWFDKCVSYTKVEDIASPKYFEYGDILFAITGESVEDIAKSAAYIGNEKCLAGGDIVVMKHKQNPKFLAYALSTFDARQQKSKGKIKSKVVHSNVPSIENIEIYLPPMEVQERIVKVLDNFDAICSDLGIGLPAEIEKRQKQYEYYREKLLTFDGKYATILTERNGTERNGTERNGTERVGLIRLLQYVYGFVFVELESVLRIRNGKDYKHLGGGDIPVYGSGGIMAQVNTCIYDKPTVLIPRKGSIDKLYYTEKPFWNVDTIFYTEIDENFAIAKYIYYCLQKEHLEDYNTAGGVPSLTQTVLNKIVIPLPTLDKQKEIVDILDKFDSLCNDLSAGLPAEIEHRQKQYEYYRDKLLTF